MNEPMNYALIGDDGVVTNVIWLCSANRGDFSNVICVCDRPVAIGDRYIDGVFTRNGEAVLTNAELLVAQEPKRT